MLELDDVHGLVRAAARGDEAAFNVLYDRYHKLVYRFAYLKLLNAVDAEQVMQESFLKLYRHLPALANGPELKLAAWLCQVTNNMTIDILRRRQRLHMDPWIDYAHDSLLPASGWDDPARCVERDETSQRVQSTIARMSPRHRKAIHLRMFEGRSCQEIADAMGMSRSAVKSMLFRMRDDFRAIWQADERAAEKGIAA